MPNGKHGDNPLSDLTIHGQHPFPSDIEKMLLRINTLGRRPGRWPLGENWPFSPREFQWERGENLDDARRDLAHLISMLEAGRGDEILVIGDTPLDVECAKSIQAKILAVATGNFPRKDLVAHQPTWAVETLEEISVEELSAG